MRRFTLKGLLLFSLIISCSSTFAQEIVDTDINNQNFQEYSNNTSTPERIEANNNEFNSNQLDITEPQNLITNNNGYIYSEESSAIKDANEQIITNEDVIASSRMADLPGSTTSAPPDCPECTPDPGGDVIDVPFDKNLLVFLFAGAAFIIVKDDKKKRKEK